MEDEDRLAEQFEANRPHLRAVAYRMLGSMTDAEDAVQESWLRLSRSDASAVNNLGGWLTTVVGRVCLDMLRARRSRPEEPAGDRLPEPVVRIDDGGDPEGAALMADSVSMALLVVLEALDPPERLAFVLHDMFAVPFDEIARILDRSPAAARQLASRARRRVRGAPAVPPTDLAEQRAVVDAFLAAARTGDFDALVAVLHPDAVFRADPGPLAAASVVPVRGAEAVARQVLARGARLARFARPAIVNGAAGTIVAPGGVPRAVTAFMIAEGRIVEIDVFADPQRIGRLDLDLPPA